MALQRRTEPCPHWWFGDPGSGDGLRLVLLIAAAATAEPLGRLGEGGDLPWVGPGAAGAGPVRLLDPAAGQAVSLESSAPFDCVLIWSEPPRPMVCLEPWTGPRGALVSGERRLLLAAGEEITLDCCYRVEALG